MNDLELYKKLYGKDKFKKNTFLFYNGDQWFVINDRDNKSTLKSETSRKEIIIKTDSLYKIEFETDIKNIPNIDKIIYIYNKYLIIYDNNPNIKLRNIQDPYDIYEFTYDEYFRELKKILSIIWLNKPQKPLEPIFNGLHMRGLPNIGNTCYKNVLFQMFIKCVSNSKNLFEEIINYRNDNTKNDNEKYIVLQKFVKYYFTESVYITEEIMMELSEYFGNTRVNSLEDPTYYIDSILTLYKNFFECKHTYIDVKSRSTGKTNKDGLLIGENYQSLEENTSTTILLNFNLAGKKLDFNDKQLSLITFPKYLFINIQNSEKKHINNIVENIGNNSFIKNFNDTIYILIGFIVNLPGGSSGTGGHYTAYSYINYEWYLFNDTIIGKINSDNILNEYNYERANKSIIKIPPLIQQATILLFERIGFDEPIQSPIRKNPDRKTPIRQTPVKLFQVNTPTKNYTVCQSQQQLSLIDNIFHVSNVSGAKTFAVLPDGTVI